MRVSCSSSLFYSARAQGVKPEKDISVLDASEQSSFAFSLPQKIMAKRATLLGVAWMKNLSLPA